MSAIILTEQAAPSAPAATRHTVYFKEDGFLYQKDSTGLETKVGTTANDVVFYDKGDSGTTNQVFDRMQGGVPTRHQRLKITGAQTFSVVNWEPAGILSELLIELVDGGAFLTGWPTIIWDKADGTTTTTFSLNGVTLKTSGTDFALLWTRDGGATVRGKVAR